MIIALQAVLFPATDISFFPASPETAAALLRESYAFVLESGSVPRCVADNVQIMCSLLIYRVFSRARRFIRFFTALVFLVSYHISSSDSNVDYTH